VFHKSVILGLFIFGRPLRQVIQGHRCWHFYEACCQACYYTQHVCAYLQPFSPFKRTNSAKTTSFQRERPFFSPSFEGTPLTQQHEIWSQDTKDFRLSYGKNRSLYLARFPNGTGLWHHHIYSFNVKLTSATFNNATTRYIINLNLKKTCKRKHLTVCPKAINNFNETYFKNYRYRQNK